MPLSKDHKKESKQKILKSAFQLFTLKGYELVTIDMLMKNCGLTRGAFYLHFSSKSALYNESLEYAAAETTLAQLKPKDITDKLWMTLLLDGYLSVEHVNGTRPCPLAFLANDVVNRNNNTKGTYTDIYEGMNSAIMSYTQKYSSCTKEDILAVTSMIIGAVAICRTINNEKTIFNILKACRVDAGKKLGGA
jgi:AcrR family transcriptional regulator